MLQSEMQAMRELMQGDLHKEIASSIRQEVRSCIGCAVRWARRPCQFTILGTLKSGWLFSPVSIAFYLTQSWFQGRGRAKFATQAAGTATGSTHGRVDRRT